MKLERIEIEEFRRFREPLVLDELQDGLNIFVGSNEAGKSTVAAALRAAFLERFKTRAVADLAPWGMSQARPTVTLDFRIGESRYRLCKSFLNRARCDLSIDGGKQRLEGEEAESMLAELLGFQFAGKGQGKPEHAGIPGLLWIAQGDSPQLLGPAAHAGTHVRQALTQLSGELSATEGDRLFARVSDERAVLLDLRGKSKGPLKTAEDAAVQAEAQQRQWQEEKQALDADVDKLALWRAEHERSQREQAWQAFDIQAQQARARVAAAGKAREQVDQLERERRRLDSTLSLLRDRIRRDRDDRENVERLAAQVGETQLAAEAAQRTLAAARGALADSEREAAAARMRHEAARIAALRSDLAEQGVRATMEIDRLAGALQKAEALIEGEQALIRTCAENELAQSELEDLRAAEQDLSHKLAQQQAVATRVSYALAPGRSLEIGGRAVTGADGLLVASSLTIDIPDVGQLTVEPGGRDLPALASAIDTAGGRRLELLARLGLPDLAAAEARWVTFESSRRELELTRKALALYAPAGRDTLRGQYDEAQARLAQLRSRADALASAPEAGGQDETVRTAPERADADLASAARAQLETERALDGAREAVSAATAGADSAAARVHALQGQLAPLADALQDPAHLQASRQRQIQLDETGAELLGLDGRLDAARTTLAGHRPELAEQDVQRFEQSARIAREAHEARRGNILQLQGRLEQAGASGVGERLSQAQAAYERTRRRAGELARRAAALDLLTDLLQAQRQAATRRLQAPLAERLRHYVPLLFPAGELLLDDALAPASLARGDTLDTLESLSFGTREQLGVLARLAYADLLRQAGRPTLIVLDDALVHTDDRRRDFMKRALFDAASRHQILMFTCHGEAWQDLGVAQRELEPPRDRQTRPSGREPPIPDSL